MNTTTRDDDELLKLAMVAEWLDVSLMTVHRLIRTDGLPVRRLRHSWRVRVGDLRKWIRQTPEVGV